MRKAGAKAHPNSEGFFRDFFRGALKARQSGASTQNHFFSGSWLTLIRKIQELLDGARLGRG